jgi:predicted glycogen debranching enzyme
MMKSIGSTRSAGSRVMTALSRSICTDFAQAEEREWLVTNGLGSFASGTVAGTQTRRYHGLLVAALKPPGGRTFLVAKLEESAAYGGRNYELGANRWAGGALAPTGFHYLTGFRLEGTVPVWTFACADAVLEKCVWMEQGAQTTYISYRVLDCSEPLRLELRALVNYRDFHGVTQAGDWRMTIDPVADGVCVQAFDSAVPFFVRAAGAACETAHEWYRDFDLSAERARGLSDREDHLHAATFVGSLQSGQSLTVVASLEDSPLRAANGDAGLARRHAHDSALLTAFDVRTAGREPDWVRSLALAADQFVVDVPAAPNQAPLQTIVAGYHWFSDWGRDTMIALDGLTLATGRPEIAKNILETFARYVDGGMLPNYFPEVGRTAEFNTVDAALWYVEAVRRYVAYTKDLASAERLYPTLVEIVRNYRDGTRYGIRQDADGLITAGGPGLQLTWMDAKVGDWVVTPRSGKPVEVNALWYNALLTLDALAQTLNRPQDAYRHMAETTQAGFQRFWNAEREYCFDVLDGHGGNDARLRPNQLLAVALPHSPLDLERQRSVVEVCTRRLLTPAGLRSLADDEPDYRPAYGGTPVERDGAYHQGTVWAWLIGPWADAHLRVFGNPEAVRHRLAGLAAQRDGYGVGTLAEIASGDAPNLPNGCIAQAWSVAEVLRAWRACGRAA